MKQISLFFTFLLVFIGILSACSINFSSSNTSNTSSSNISLELVRAEVEIVKDKRKTGATILQEGEKAEKEVVPTSLYYTFTIKNKANKKIGDIGKGEGLEVRIEPTEKLVAASNEVMGFNIFELDDYDGSGLGFGSSFFADNRTGEFHINYELGVEEETKEILPVPSKEKLEQLKENALEATLIVSLGKEEITRFDLSKKK